MDIEMRSPRSTTVISKLSVESSISSDSNSEENDIRNHRHVLYARDIETCDDFTATAATVRAIYDGDEHQMFMEKLDTRIKNHDKDIERMCNFHYQGFIDSIKELLEVRPHAQKLKNEVVQTDRELSESARHVVQNAKELVKYRKIQCNTGQVIDSLKMCQPVLKTYAKLNQQMKKKKYYSALKTLEQLEHTFLPTISRYHFAQVMGSSVPFYRNRIKEASLSDLKDFLENIRKLSSKIGESAMRQAAEEQQIVETGMMLKKTKRRAPPPPNPFTGEVESKAEADAPAIDIEEELSAQFSLLYRCLHIHSVLEARETFETNYRRERNHQSKLFLQPPTNMHETLEGYQTYFSGIAGFFVVEDHILNTANGLVNRAYLDELWDNALSKIIASLRTHANYCKEPKTLLDMKKPVLLFCYTLKGYGYAVGQLYDLLLEFYKKYSELLLTEWAEVFRRIFESDDYNPIQVDNEKEYNQIVDIFPYNQSSMEKAQYPRTFPFSRFVPRVFAEVKNFIYALHNFSDGLSLSQSALEDLIRRSTNHLLTDTLSACLSELIKKPNLGLHQLIQISVNTDYLEDASSSLERLISSITNSPGDGSHILKLESQRMLKNARKDAEAQIYQQLNKKIDGFIELANYDWLLNEPEQGQASSYIVDMITFLKNTFEVLPDTMTETARISACRYIASSLMNVLLNKELKYISYGAVLQFSLDVIQCEQFASSLPVVGFEGIELPMCFTDLRQLLDLFTTWDWSTYLHEYGQEKGKYSRVPANTVVNILEKVREADRRKNFFSSLKKNERDKKKLLETVLKKLKQRMTNGT